MRTIKNFAPGFKCCAEGAIGCPNGGCSGRVSFDLVLISRTTQGSFLEKTPMWQPTPEVVIKEIGPILEKSMESENYPDPFYRLVGYVGGNLAHRRVDCPECGITFAATNDQERAILEQALEWANKLQPADVPLWDENEEGVLTPEGHRIKPVIVTYNPFPGFKLTPKDSAVTGAPDSDPVGEGLT